MPHLIAHETLGVRVIRPRSFARVRRVVARAAIVTRRLSPASTRPAPSHLSTVPDRVSRASTPETDQFTLPHPPVGFRRRRQPRAASTASTRASSTASSAAASTARHDSRATRFRARVDFRSVRRISFRSMPFDAPPAASRASSARGCRRARSSAVASLFRAFDFDSIHSSCPRSTRCSRRARARSRVARRPRPRRPRPRRPRASPRARRVRFRTRSTRCVSPTSRARWTRTRRGRARETSWAGAGDYNRASPTSVCARRGSTRSGRSCSTPVRRCRCTTTRG